MDESLSFTVQVGRVQGKLPVLVLNAAFLKGNSKPRAFLLGLAARLDSLPRGDGVRMISVLGSSLTLS